MSDAIKEVELLFPSGKEVTLKGKTKTIKPFGFGKYPRVLKILKALRFEQAVGSSAEAIEAVKSASLDVVELIVQNSESVVDICCLATGENREFFDDLPADEAVELCQAIVEVNADFFAKRLQPKLLKALSGLSESVGGMLSQGSLQAVTA